MSDIAPSGSRTTDPVDLDRTRRLFEYISKVALLQSTVVTDIRNASSYEEIVWFGTLPDAAEVQSAVRGNPGTRGQWLLVKRPRFVPPPTVPDVLSPWLDPARIRDSGRTLALNEAATELREVESPDGGTETRAVVIELSDAPDITEEFDEYLPRWSVWAAEDRRLQPIHDIYSSLFAIQQRVTTLQEQYEVVVGVGLVTRRRGHATIRRHLLVARADVAMDAESGQITVGPAGDGLGLHLEAEMLEADEYPPPDSVRALSDRLIDLDDPLAPGAADPVLQTWTHGSGEDSRYDDSVTEPAAVEQRLVVTYAPAVILRRRTRRAIANFCQSVVDGLESGVEIPGAIRDLIERPANEPPETDPEDDESVAVDPMFPLPANEEQQEIVARLERAPGIVVEGPPGTGKSHTIANLIAHLTASGQRVLVTSHTARALKVVKGKLPDGIADLCVDVLGEGKERRDNLERSITALLARHNDAEWSGRRPGERIERYRKQKAQLEAQRTELVAEQRRARELEVIDHDPGIGDYRGTLSAIALRVFADEARYGWLTEGGDGTPPECLRLVPALLESERAITPRLLELARFTIPDLDGIPTPMEVRDALDDIERLKGRAPEVVSRSVHLLAEADPEVRAGITRTVAALRAAVLEASASQAPWAHAAVSAILSGQGAAWLSLDRLTADGLARLDPRLGDLDRVTVTGVTDENEGRIWDQATALRAHLVAGGRLSRLGRRPEVVEAADELLNRVRVDGESPSTPDLLGLLLRCLAAQRALFAVESRWGDLLPVLGPTPSIRREAVRIAHQHLLVMLRVQTALDAANERIRALPTLTAPDWRSEASVDAFLDEVDRADVVARLEASRVVLRDRLRPLRDASLDRACAPSVKDAAGSALGGDVERYAAALDELREIAEARASVAVRNERAIGVSSALPAMVAAIRADPHDARWDRQARDLVPAWEWRRARRWLDAVRDVRPDREIAAELDAVEAWIGRLVGQITEHLAWQHTLKLLTPGVQANLKAYQAEMGKYGKGTGIHAQHHLSEARRYLEACQTAVPVWIMPTHLVADTIAARPAAFDVVIVDEASQSGVDASFLMWLGRKLIVVGDEKQISPDLVGLDRAAARNLAKTLLPDFHFASVLEVDHSLFTQATVRYRSRIRLREHFRCMPEIIEFSNKIAYADAPLIPLRQYGSARLEPLVARYVEGGETRSVGGGKVNDREAEQIVATIERLCGDPAYKGKTMGVISLLGGQQARRVNDLLVRTLSPNEIADRRIQCGDAYAFQGDERDVILLSMVAAPEADGSRLPVASERTFNQRFNVAASRAKDQEWLFHSVTLQDLKPEDLRHRLLTHFVAPTSETIEEELADVPDDTLAEPFESIFEQRVFKAIRRRGYRATAQVPVHKYRIDLVVTGRDRKLAVECDGDRWHGDEQYAKDQSRQRDLQRCGWTFVRIRGSEFFADPEGALQPLWEELARLGITPWESPAATARAAPRPDDSAEHTATATVRSPEPVPPDSQPAGSEPPPTEGATLPEVVQPPAPIVGSVRDQFDQPPLLPDEDSIWSRQTLADTGRSPTAQAVTAPTGPADLPAEPIPAYARWEPSEPVPHPGTPAATTARLAGLIVEIVRAEGPVSVDLIFDRLIKASGGQRVSRGSRRELNQALSSALRKGWVVGRDPLRRPGLAGQIIRLPSGRPIVVRQRGDRDLQEIPPDEVAALCRVLAIRSGFQPGEALKRAVLDFYARTRLTEAASRFLDSCFSLFGDDTVREEADRVSAALRASGSPPPARMRGSDVETPHTSATGPLEAAAAPQQTARREVAKEAEHTDGSGWEGPPFWEVVSDAARAAGMFTGRQQQALEALWRDVDGSDALEALQREARSRGAENDWPAVARVVAGSLPSASALFRRAVVAVACIRYWREHVAEGGPPPEVPDAPRRLLEAFDAAEREVKRIRSSSASRDGCIHGAARGSCLYVACQNHPLGGIDTTGD